MAMLLSSATKLLLPDGPFLQARGALTHLRVRGAPQLPTCKGTEEIVQLWLEMLQDQPQNLRSVVL